MTRGDYSTMSLMGQDGHGGGLDVELVARISAGIDGLTGEMRRQREERQRLNQAIYPVTIPAQQGKVPASGTLTIANAEDLGPRTGIYWDVRRVTVAGLAANEVITLYRGSIGAAADAVPNNEVTQITNQTTNAKDGIYSPGLGACLLRAGQSLVINGTGLTNAELITVTWDAISIDAPWLGAYLL